MIEKTFHFLSGLPRSGSTVLGAILNQNPAVYATPTSPLLDQLVENQNIWNSLQAVKANPFPEQLTNITRQLINGVWQHRNEPIIIDKNRGWGKNMPASTVLFGQEIKLVATTRDLPSIMASWLELFRKNPQNLMKDTLIFQGMMYTDENIMFEMWTNMVKDCLESLAAAKKDAVNRILIVDYDDLVANPGGVLRSIESFLEIPAYDYKYTNIISDNIDDDLAAWGLDGMHRIRPGLEKTARDPRLVLGDRLYQRFVDIECQYAKI